MARGNLDPNHPSTDSEIFHYDLNTGTTTQLTDDEYEDGLVVLSGSNVVWVVFDGDTTEIFLATLALPGDFGGDGDVDGADFLAWQCNPGLGSLSDWQANYGQPPGSSADSSANVPGAGHTAARLRRVRHELRLLPQEAIMRCLSSRAAEVSILGLPATGGVFPSLANRLVKRAWRAAKKLPLRMAFLAVVAAVLLVACSNSASAQAFVNDNDGLLDVGEAPGFPADPMAATGELSLDYRGIQDLDGTSLLTNLQTLDLSYNDITSIEAGDFDGLTNLQSLT